MDQLTKKQVNITRLLDQGVSLLTDKGYHGSGLKEILAAVQIPKGSFYNYFDSKEAFVVEAIQHYITPFIGQLAAHLHNPDQEDALTAIKQYFAGLITDLEANEFKGGCLLGNLMGELGDSNEVIGQALRAAVWQYRDLLQTGLSRAQQEGTVRTDKSSQEMADLLVNTWQGALLRMKIEQSTLPLRQCCENLLDEYFRV